MNLFIGCSSREDIPDKYFKDCEMLLDNTSSLKKDVGSSKG